MWCQESSTLVHRCTCNSLLHHCTAPLYGIIIYYLAREELQQISQGFPMLIINTVQTRQALALQLQLGKANNCPIPLVVDLALTLSDKEGVQKNTSIVHHILPSQPSWTDLALSPVAPATQPPTPAKIVYFLLVLATNSICKADMDTTM